LRTGVSTTGKIESKTEANASCCTSKSSCCPAAAESTVTESATDSEEETNNNSIPVEQIDNPSRWEDVYNSSKNGTLIVKFTAEWCKPCKQIQPCYEALSKKHGKCKFVTVDVDECDEIASKSKVAMMPTFVCFKNGEEVGRMSGSGGDKLRGWVGEMCA
jgi:thioredoxin 1